MVRNACALPCRRLGGTDVQFAINRHRIARKHLATERFGQNNRQRSLSTRRRTRNHNQWIPLTRIRRRNRAGIHTRFGRRNRRLRAHHRCHQPAGNARPAPPCHNANSTTRTASRISPRRMLRRSTPSRSPRVDLPLILGTGSTPRQRRRHGRLCPLGRAGGRRLPGPFPGAFPGAFPARCFRCRFPFHRCPTRFSG